MNQLIEQKFLALFEQQWGKKADLARELQEKGTYADTESLLNYKGKTKSGEFLSSTYFIKNEGRLIGMLCVNKELAAAQELNLALRALLDRFNLSAPPEDSPSEDLSSPLESVMHSRIAEIISREGRWCFRTLALPGRLQSCRLPRRRGGYLP